MDTMPPLSISPVLREAAELKVDELNHAKEEFKRRYHFNTGRSAGTDTATRVKSLLDDISRLDPELEDDDDLEIIARYAKQAMDDGSVSDLKILKFEEQIRNKLHKHLNRLELSSLHVELMKEAMDSGESSASVAAKLESCDLDDDFEVVENELDEVLERFEKETFSADEIDVEAIEAYLSTIFEDTDDKRDLEEIRNDLQTFGEQFLADGADMDQDFLMACIVDLLKNGLVGKDKKKKLEGYLQSPIALRELVATLNMKSVRYWAYKNADEGLSVTARHNAEGQYRIVVEESIIDLLFLQCMGIGWAMRLKSCLNEVPRNCSCLFKVGLSVEEKNKREYFLGRKPADTTVTPPNVCSFCHPHYPPAPMPPPPPPMNFCPPPPPPPPPMITIPPIRKSKKREAKCSWYSPPPPPPPYTNMIVTRHRQYSREYFMSRLPIQDGCTPKVTPAEEVQANLIKTLVVERKLREAFDGQVHAGSAHFKSLASSLPHQTILTVLKFLGVPETSLEFFERFLSAKLNIGPAVRGAPDRILPRTRGLPEGHALELFLTEAVMFALELVVHKKTGSYLYRLEDRCYFVGNYEQHRTYEQQVAKFANALGLHVTFERAQSIGFLSIDARGAIIDDHKVSTYARNIKQQLDACTAVLDWVRVWNSTAGTYASHLFGPLADVFGKAHLDAVKKAYKQIFDIIFDGGNLTSHIKKLLTTHLKPPLSDPSFSLEALIYLPQAYGGLGVKNPFITLSLANTINDDPSEVITKYLDTEETYYKRAAENYARLSPDAYGRKIEVIFANDNARVEAALGASRDLSVFMTKEELTAHRERAAYPYLPFPPFPAPYTPTTIPDPTELYSDLLNEPTDDMLCSDKISDEVRRLSGKGDMKSWSRLSSEDKWVLQLYGDECFERYGGLEIWCGESVPQEVLKVVRGASWDDTDDDSSVSDMTEP